MYNTIKVKKFNHLNINIRKIIQKLSFQHYSITQIACIVGVNKSTVSRQLSNKSNYDFLKIGNKVKLTYSPTKAQENYTKNKSNCGAKYKIFKDMNLVRFIENAIIKDKLSPDAAIGRQKLIGWNFKISITPKSVYNYIDRNQLKVTMFDLRFKLRRKKPKKKQAKENKRKLGQSIELRDKSIENRNEFGHWEIDTVVDKNQNSVLVITERMSRFGIIFKLKKKTSENVIIFLQRLQKRLGKTKFKKYFKTITCDNGSEFYQMYKLNNTKIYFTHPYSSWEKGTVENYNSIIRRYIPNGKDISKITRQKITAINKEINNLPRKILNYHTSEEIFTEQIQAI